MGRTLHVLSAYLAYRNGPSEPRLEGQISQTYSPVIEVQSDIHPTLGRIIIDGKWSGDIQTARELLDRICKRGQWENMWNV